MGIIDDIARKLCEMAGLNEEQIEEVRRRPVRRLCKDIMCFGTPEEIARLINAGYVHLLKIMPATLVGVDKTRGIAVPTEIYTVQIAADENGCAMYKDGKCLLRESGLTPELGKLHFEGVFQKSHIETILTWGDCANIETVIYCLRSVTELCNNKNNHTN